MAHLVYQGSAVAEHQTTNGEVLGMIPTLGALFCPGARQINSPELWCIPRKGRLHPDLAEKLFTGTLNLNANIHQCKIVSHQRRCGSHWSRKKVFSRQNLSINVAMYRDACKSHLGGCLPILIAHSFVSKLPLNFDFHL